MLMHLMPQFDHRRRTALDRGVNFGVGNGAAPLHLRHGRARKRQRCRKK
jgi:hypothetical protein